MEYRVRHFNVRRLGRLLRRDAVVGRQGVLTAMLAVAGFVLVISALSMLGRIDSGFHTDMYARLLFIGGFIVTSLAFREVGSNGRGYLYLTLPASPEEKFASKLLLTSLGYAAGSLVFYTAVAALSEALNRLLFGSGHPFFNPFSVEVLRLGAAYLVMQSVFLAGSAYFRKMAFIRTALFTIAVNIAIAAVLGLAVLLLFRDLLPFEAHAESLEAELQVRVEGLARSFAAVLRVIFWAALAPVCWLIGYLRLREIEA